MNHWIRPSCDSRTGASHLRRGAPCQDASGFAGFRDAAGTPVQVLVVSDGHGGSRYVRSDVGARLACEVALRTVEQTLRTSRTGQAGSESEWRQWLAETLPQAIVEAWLEEVQRHWQAQGPQGSESVPASLPALAAGSAEAAAAASPAGFSPIPYGATLGLLVLTPRWWGYTGLGDWDLVRIEAAGEGRLISEESEAGGGSEATYSLCMQGAARYFAPRTALLPLTVDTAPFALLLCSDGLRKSCGSDADFLTLCRYLVGLAPAADQAVRCRRRHGASPWAAATTSASRWPGGLRRVRPRAGPGRAGVCRRGWCSRRLRWSPGSRSMRRRRTVWWQRGWGRPHLRKARVGSGSPLPFLERQRELRRRRSPPAALDPPPAGPSRLLAVGPALLFTGGGASGSWWHWCCWAWVVPDW